MANRQHDNHYESLVIINEFIVLYFSAYEQLRTLLCAKNSENYWNIHRSYYPVTFIKYASAKGNGYHIMDFILMITFRHLEMQKTNTIYIVKRDLSYSPSQIKDICKSLHSIIDPLEQ